MRIAGDNAKCDRRQNSRFIASRAPLVALIVLFCLSPLLAAEGRQTGPMVRREAPFPEILDLEAATDGVPLRYEVLRGDFHMHTTHSDGLLSPPDRVLEAWRYGYDVIAITDHRNFEAYEKAQPFAEDLDIIFLRGMETGIHEQEHFVALDFAADYVPRDPHHWSETGDDGRVFYQHQWQRLADAGGFVLYAHPHVGLRETVLWGIGQGLLQGIEVKNDVVGSEWNTVESHGTYWYPFALTWAAEYNLTIFANSDVHGPRGDIEQAVTLVLATDRSREAVMEALRAGRTLAQFNNMLCAHEWVFQLLMANLVTVYPQKLNDGRAFIHLQNHGPVELIAELTGTPLEPVVLGPYQQTLAGVRGLPSTLTVNWKNLYTLPTQNFTTIHTFTPLPK
jgi:predicted metal-dependent phosphoesterase TrpH